MELAGIFAAMGRILAQVGFRHTFAYRLNGVAFVVAHLGARALPLCAMLHSLWAYPLRLRLPGGSARAPPWYMEEIMHTGCQAAPIALLMDTFWAWTMARRALGSGQW